MIPGPAARDKKPNKAFLIGAAVPLTVVALIAWAIVWMIGSHNCETPAGYVGYLTQGAIFGKTKFYGVQKGPTSSGRTWLLNVVNVSITPYTYKESFEGDSAVLAKDNLKLTFHVHMVWHVDETKVSQFVERYSYLEKGADSDKVVEIAYENFLKEPLRTYSRTEIQNNNGFAVQTQISEMGTHIQEKVKQLVTGTPFVVTSIVVGNIQYPPDVQKRIEEKVSAEQDLERMKTQVKIAGQDKLRRVAEAEGIAAAMAIINGQLTAIYVQHEAVEAQKAMVGSPNHSVMYIPVGANGVPIVHTIGGEPRR